MTNQMKESQNIKILHGDNVKKVCYTKKYI